MVDKSRPSSCLNAEVADPETGETGVVVGKLVFSAGGNAIDCARMGLSGVAIPLNLDAVKIISTQAEFILLVENNSAFDRLAEDRFYNNHNCVIISSKGYKIGQPNVPTINFLNKVHSELNLPVLALFDCDQLAFQLLWTYGCEIKWLGIRPTDLDKYKIPQGSRDLMTEEDLVTAKEMLEEDFVKKNRGWVEELKLMVEKKHKAPVESLCGRSLRFLTEVYLPRKLKEEDWL